MITQMGEQGFRWFFGTVEDNNDPLKLGRVKVRIINEHNKYLTTDQLAWSQVMLPTTSGRYQGVGDTPNLQEGSMVVGFYVDTNEKQLTMIMGSFPIIPDMDSDKHSISNLARGKQTLNKELLGPEPASPYAAQYPYNRVIQTKGGHVIELDDTPENERVHIWHSSGSYIEMNNEGQTTYKSVSDRYDIVSGNQQTYIDGDYNLYVSGKFNVIAQGDISQVAIGDHTTTAGGTVNQNGANGIVHTSGTDISLKSPGGVGVPYSGVQASGAMSSGVGISGSFTTPSGKTIHVTNGLVTNMN